MEVLLLNSPSYRKNSVEFVLFRIIIELNSVYNFSSLSEGNALKY